jgi:uncharacterized protein (DUF1499 family)
MMGLNLLWQKRALSIGASMVFINSMLGEPVFPAGLPEGKLAPCPASPNCISTQSVEPKKHMPPLPYSGSREESRQVILSIVKSMPRVKVVAETDNYIHAEFRSRIFRFVDDVEFLFDEGEKVILFRSASRTGYSDLGVNRRRMQKISERYLKTLK